MVGHEGSAEQGLLRCAGVCSEQRVVLGPENPRRLKGRPGETQPSVLTANIGAGVSRLDGCRTDIGHDHPASRYALSTSR